MSGKTTKDQANQHGYSVQSQIGETRFGVLKNWEWHDDPKRILFSMARYKFVSKMFAGRDRVLEVGCGDGFNAPVVRQTVKSLTIADFDPIFIDDARARMRERWPYEAIVVDVLKDELPHGYDGVYSLDMLEHIPQSREHIVLEKMVRALTDDGAVIIGMPSLESQVYASAPSKLGHINCKTGPELETLMKRYFHNVFMFSMNDELVHTGFHRMAHYLIAVACQKK
jgi:2-polyprenyl-3-methyl-5-hydroxy-6-metoxy-1,4-benzoquinol methylase